MTLARVTLDRPARRPHGVRRAGLPRAFAERRPKPVARIEEILDRLARGEADELRQELLGGR